MFEKWGIQKVNSEAGVVGVCLESQHLRDGGRRIGGRSSRTALAA